MNTTRRQVLGLVGMGLVASVLSGCESLEQRATHTKLSADALPPATMLADSPERRLLNRMAYGPRPGDLARVSQIGTVAYIEEQLDPEAIAEEPLLTWRLGSIADVLTPDPGLLFDEDDNHVVSALRQATILRAVYSNRQLLERTVEFWTDHFNIYAFKGQGPQLKVVDDHEAIRQHALGSFRDLLGASARSAAMLGYLDNSVNRRGIANENYARELMELHTLGVHGGYTQRDVTEVARCLTGWTAEKHWHRGRFMFDPDTHDNGPKCVLGVNIPAGGGITDGERVLDIVAAHPATARHLATKFCRHFRGDVSEPWVTRLANIYQSTHGDIKAMLRPLLTSGLTDAPPILKRPLDYAVSALRVFNADTDGSAGVQSHLEQMGQPLFGWPMPDGFPEGTKAWSGAMVPRWNFALALAGQTVENTSLDMTALTHAGQAAGLTAHETLLELAFGCRADVSALANLRIVASAYPDISEYAATMLMAPAFQWR